MKNVLESGSYRVQVRNITLKGVDSLDDTAIKSPELVIAYPLQVAAQNTANEAAHSRYQNVLHKSRSPF